MMDWLFSDDLGGVEPLGLTAREAEVVRRVDVDGLTLDECAEELGVTGSAVCLSRKRAFRALGVEAPPIVMNRTRPKQVRETAVRPARSLPRLERKWSFGRMVRRYAAVIAEAKS